MLTLNTLFFGQMAKHLLDSSKRDIRETFMRSSRPDVFCKKGALRDFAKFTGKHLCQSLYFNKVAVWTAKRACLKIFEKNAGNFAV